MGGDTNMDEDAKDDDVIDSFLLILN